MNEEELTQFNQIDMECNPDPDDTLALDLKSSKKSFDNVSDNSEERNLLSKTGVILDLSEDDYVQSNFDMIANKESEEKINNPTGKDLPIEGINLIDMDTKFLDDMEVDSIDSLDNDIYIEAQDQDEDYAEMIVNNDETKNKKEINGAMSENVSPNYLKDEQKKHAKSIKKGAYNMSFHFSGNPEKEREMFNHDMKTGGPIDQGIHASVTGDVPAEFVGSNYDSSRSASATGESSGQGMSVGEEFNQDTNSETSLIDEALDNLEIDVIENRDESFTIKDNLGEFPDIECTTKKEVLDTLLPYITDLYVYPLCFKANKEFNNLNDFCNWYREEGELKYPNFKHDVDCCIVILKEFEES